MSTACKDSRVQISMDGKGRVTDNIMIGSAERPRLLSEDRLFVNQFCIQGTFSFNLKKRFFKLRFALITTHKKSWKLVHVFES